MILAAFGDFLRFPPSLAYHNFLSCAQEDGKSGGFWVRFELRAALIRDL